MTVTSSTTADRPQRNPLHPAALVLIIFFCFCLLESQCWLNIAARAPVQPVYPKLAKSAGRTPE